MEFYGKALVRTNSFKPFSLKENQCPKDGVTYKFLVYVANLPDKNSSTLEILQNPHTQRASG
jgi:hypothetical protein